MPRDLPLRFIPAASADASDALLRHPFTQILARGPPPKEVAGPPLTTEELGEVGRAILREL
jgi:hypothetical protein